MSLKKHGVGEIIQVDSQDDDDATKTEEEEQ